MFTLNIGERDSVNLIPDIVVVLWVFWHVYVLFVFFLWDIMNNSLIIYRIHILK